MEGLRVECGKAAGASNVRAEQSAARVLNVIFQGLLVELPSLGLQTDLLALSVPSAFATSGGNS